MQPIKTRTACNTTKHTWTQERATERTWDRTLPQRDKTWSASVRTPTRNRNSRHECRDPNTTFQRETRHADERAHSSSTLEAARSHMKTGHDGSIRALSQTMNNPRPKWQNPDTMNDNQIKNDVETSNYWFVDLTILIVYIETICYIYSKNLYYIYA